MEKTITSAEFQHLFRTGQIGYDKRGFSSNSLDPDMQKIADELHPKKRQKYNNEKTQYNGEWYDSKKEAAYAKKLDIMKDTGLVESWSRQECYKVVINDQTICRYYLDFLVRYSDGRIEHVDVKGVETDVFKLKKKLIEAIFKIKILTP